MIHLEQTFSRLKITLLPMLLFLVYSYQTQAQDKSFSSVNVSGYQPTTGHHLTNKTIEFAFDIYNFPVSNFQISANITNDDTPGFYIDGELYKPENYPSWSDYLGSCSNTVYKMSGYLVINNDTRFSFTNVDVMAAHTQTPSGQINFPQEIMVKTARFENVQIVGVEQSSVRQGANTFLRWLNAQETEKEETIRQNTNNGNSRTSNSNSVNSEYDNTSYSTKSSSQSSTSRSNEQFEREWAAEQSAKRKIAEGDTEGAIRDYKRAGMETDAAAVAMASALSGAELGEFKASYLTIMGGLSVSNSEDIAEDYGTYSGSVTFQGKGKFFAMEFGAKYSDSFYYEAVGFVFGAGFGIGKENTGVMFFGGVDALIIGISDSEAYLDEDGESGLLLNYGLPYNFSGTLYHGVADGPVGLTFGVKHYLGDALFGATEDIGGAVLPNPYPSTHLTIGLAF